MRLKTYTNMPQVNNSEIPVNPNLNRATDENGTLNNLFERITFDESIIRLNLFNKISEISIEIKNHINKAMETIDLNEVICRIKKSSREIIEPIKLLKMQKNLNMNFMKLKNYNDLRGTSKWKV